MSTAEDWIKKLQLLPHPEGGYFRELYRAPFSLSGEYYPQKFDSPRNTATSIYFLLKAGQISHFHQLKSDELWYFHDGKPIKIHILHSSGEYETKLLGNSLGEQCHLQIILPAGVIFAAEVNSPTGFSLVGCMVTPGFDFTDFKLYKFEELKDKYPDHKEILQKYCHT